MLCINFISIGQSEVKLELSYNIGNAGGRKDRRTGVITIRRGPNEQLGFH